LSNFADREIRVIPRLAFDLNGSAFDSAQATPFAQNRQTDLLQIHGSILPPSGLHARLGAGALRAGTLNADLTLDFETGRCHAPGQDQWRCTVAGYRPWMLRGNHC
jgi:hypothetical protein